MSGVPIRWQAGESPQAESATLREAVGVIPAPPVVVLRIGGGEAAFAWLDRLSTAPLYLREGELRQTLLLNEAGQPFADATIASDEDGYFLLAEGPSQPALLAYLQQHAPAGSADVPIEPLAASHVLVGLHGPYAWELASALMGPSVLGMTYLSLLRVQEVVCFRAGRTGEYGYDLLIPRDRLAHWLEKIEQVGAPLDARPIGLQTLDLAAIENWQFTMRSLGVAAATAGLTPIELQLQWRVSYDRPFVGAEELAARRAAGPRQRVTCFAASGGLRPGDPVVWGDQEMGQVLATAWSHLRAQQVGVALLDRRFAHPHIDVFQARGAAGPVPIRTCTPPLLNNRSLYVDPHRHSYATREVDSFPPLVLQ